MSIQIPADLTIVTLRASGSELPQRFTESHAISILQAAGNLLRDRADIEFRLGLFESVIEEMPDSVRSDAVDDGGYHFLASRHPARTGVRVLLVDRAASGELGGESRRETRVCLLVYF